MYNTGVAAGAINTGVPAAILAVSAADSWPTIGGAALLVVAALNGLLLARNARQRTRVFPVSA